MRSNTCLLNGNNPDMEAVYAEVAKVASYNGLTEKQEMHLRLLAEETIGMEKGILGFNEGEFFIDNTDNVYRICIHADINVDIMTKERFLDLAKNGKNEAYKGFMGKIRFVADALLNDSGSNPFVYANSEEISTNPMCVFGNNEYENLWSFGDFRESMESDGEIWDELEHSIVANLADDIIIGVRNNYVDIIVVETI